MFQDPKQKKQALSHLKKDQKLKSVIISHSFPQWPEKYDLFQGLVESIINQQLSSKAADTITKRFVKLFNAKSFPKPHQIIKVEDETIRKAGLSYSKIKYIKGLSQQVVDKSIDLNSTYKLQDEEALNLLTSIKGIGPWTAEMVLMFTLKRPDIFSMGDIGLRNAIAKLYNVDRNDLDTIQKISQNWSPYRTLASRYLWKSLEE